MNKPARAAIALGGNIGDSPTILQAAIKTLATTPGIVVESQSSWYKTKAIGPIQPDYINGCVVLQVTISPINLLTTLLTVEEKFGRVRTEHWGPRTLDLDLLLYDDIILNQSDLQIPHPRMNQRAFVLVPLAEIAGNWLDPLSQQLIKDLVLQVDTCDVQLLQAN
jgi:2-amino-4-hydroxy-6-hydroxymethyldihydropteridine diphosphokinase